MTGSTDRSKLGPSGKSAPLDLVAALFASLLDEEPWVAFLEAGRRAFDASFMTLILTPHAALRPGMLLAPGGDVEISAEYRDTLFANDPFTGLPDGIVARFRDFVDEAQAGRDDAFWAFIDRTGDEIIGVDLLEGGFEMRVRVSRAKDQPRFDAEKIARLQAIVPHLRVAGRLFDRIAAGQIERRIYSSAIEKMAVGVIILNKTGDILRLNPTAEAILAEADGIAQRGDRVVLADRAQARMLDALLSGRDKATGPLAIRIERRTRSGDLCLSAAGTNAPAYVSDSGGPATVLYLTDPSHAPRVPAGVLRELLGLTASEATIAAAIADGSSLTDIADAFGISHNTVRAHLRAIYAKTGVNRQSKLVHLVHHSLAGLSADPL